MCPCTISSFGNASLVWVQAYWVWKTIKKAEEAGKLVLGSVSLRCWGTAILGFQDYDWLLGLKTQESKLESKARCEFACYGMAWGKRKRKQMTKQKWGHQNTLSSPRWRHLRCLLTVDWWTSDLLIQHPRAIKMLVCKRISNWSQRNCLRILTHSRVAVLMMRMPFLWDLPSHCQAILAIHLGLCHLPLLSPTLKTCSVIFHARTMCVHSSMHC